MDIKVGVDAGAAAEVYLVAMDDRPALFSLDVDTCSVAGDDLVVPDHYLVLRLRLDHDASALKVLELALFDMHFSVDRYEACGGGVISCVAFQLAVDHFDRAAVEDGDAWHFAIGLSEYSTIQGKDKLVETRI